MFAQGCSGFWGPCVSSKGEPQGFAAALCLSSVCQAPTLLSLLLYCLVVPRYAAAGQYRSGVASCKITYGVVTDPVGKVTVYKTFVAVQHMQRIRSRITQVNPGTSPSPAFVLFNLTEPFGIPTAHGMEEAKQSLIETLLETLSLDYPLSDPKSQQFLHTSTYTCMGEQVCLVSAGTVLQHLMQLHG